MFCSCWFCFKLLLMLSGFGFVVVLWLLLGCWWLFCVFCCGLLRVVALGMSLRVVRLGIGWCCFDCLVFWMCWQVGLMVLVFVARCLLCWFC